MRTCPLDGASLRPRKKTNFTCLRKVPKTQDPTTFCKVTVAGEKVLLPTKEPEPLQPVQGVPRMLLL